MPNITNQESSQKVAAMSKAMKTPRFGVEEVHCELL